jgi:hypothetical protein
MKLTTNNPASSTRQQFLKRSVALVGGTVLILSGALAVAPGAAAGDTDGVYIWQGQGASGRLRDPNFWTQMKKEFPGQNPAIQLDPSKADILTNLPGKGVVYTSTHGGWTQPDLVPDSPAPKADLIRTGPPGTPDSSITAQDLLKLRNQVGDSNMPGLTIISGCNILKHAPPGADPLTIADALGITDGKPGRTLIGFDQKIVGAGADDFFFWMLDDWLHPDADGKYRTLQEARDSALQFIKDYQDAHKDDPAYQYGGKQRDDYMGGDAYYQGTHAKIVGDPNLKATDVLKGLPPEGGDGAAHPASRAPLDDNPPPSPTPGSPPSPADDPPASPTPAPSPSDDPPSPSPASPSPAPAPLPSDDPSPSPGYEPVPLSTPPSAVPSPSPIPGSSALPGDDPGAAPSPGTALPPPWGRGYNGVAGYHGGGSGYHGGYAGASGYRGCTGGAGGCAGQSGGGCVGGAGGSGCVGGSAGGCVGGSAGGCVGGSAGGTQAGAPRGPISPRGPRPPQSAAAAGLPRPGAGKVNARTPSPKLPHPATTARMSPQGNPGASSGSRVTPHNPHEGTPQTTALTMQTHGHPNTHASAALVSGQARSSSTPQATRAASRTRTSPAPKPAARSSSSSRATAAHPASAQRQAASARRPSSSQSTSRAAKPAARASSRSRAPATRQAPARRPSSPHATSRAPRAAAPRAASSAGHSGGSRRR